MNATETEIIEQLGSDGWALTYHCVDEGSPDKESVWGVTLTRQGQSFTTEYRKGCGHRYWRKPSVAEMVGRSLHGWGTVKYIKPGQRVGQKPRRLSVLEADLWENMTEPQPPTVDEVLWSLLMDSSGIRDGQTFEDWCSDYGSDTDSLKAHKTFDACRDEWAALIRLGADFDKLDKLLQDY